MLEVLLALLSLVVTATPAPALLHTAPTQAKLNEALKVDGSLEKGALELKALVLLYRGPGEDYVEAKMEFQYGDLWRGTIPATRMVPPGVEYYVEGRTKSGQRVPLFMTARKPARVLVLPPEDADAPEKK